MQAINTHVSVEPSVRLKITEIFYSLQGEADTVGYPTVFIRLTGCPLRCHYCDTAYAFTGGEWRSLTEIMQVIQQYQTRYITVTGGEPLAQKTCLTLLQQLCDQGYRVSLETSGAFDINPVDTRVIKVVDIKTPGSGEESRNNWDNLSALKQQDQLKFVICDQQDYIWAKQQVQQRKLADYCTVWFSPAWQQQSATELAEWLLADQFPVRFQVQLHKYLWGNQPGR